MRGRKELIMTNNLKAEKIAKKQTSYQERKHVQRYNRFLHHPNTHKINWTGNIDIPGKSGGGISILRVHPNMTPYPLSDPYTRIFDYTFDSGYDSKGSKTKNMHRRGFHDSSRILNRKKNRKITYNKAMVKHHFLIKSYLNKHYRFDNNSKLAHKLSLLNSSNQKGFYYLATKGLDHKLSHMEIYAIGYYAMNHRGVKKMTNNQNGKMLQAIAKTRKHFAESGYRTIFEMMDKDPMYKSRKRNHACYGGYLSMVTRQMVADGVKQVLDNQKQYYKNMTSKLILKIIALIINQRSFDVGPGCNSPYAGTLADKRGLDTVRPRVNGKDNYVLPKSTATFELVRAWGILNNLTYSKNEMKYHLTPKQKKDLINLRFKKQTVTFKNVSKELNFTPDSYRYQKKPSQTTLLNFKVTKKLSSCLPQSLKRNDDLIDKIGTILTLKKLPSLRVKALKKLNLSAKTIDNIRKVATKTKFSGESRFSKSTMEMFLPYLEAGKNQTVAEYESGLRSKFVKKSVFSVADYHLLKRQYTNPSLWRMFSIIFRILSYFIHKLGRPLAIHIERGTEPSHNLIIRKHITDRNDQRRDRNLRIAKWLHHNHHEINSENIKKYILYHRQGGYDTIRYKKINPKLLYDGNDYYEIDHIQPRSITGDNRFSNLELISTADNRDKGARTVLQYLNGHPKDIKHFIHTVNKIYPAYAVVRDENGHPKTHKVTKKDKNGKKITVREKIYKPTNVAVRAHLLRKIPFDAHKMFMARDLVTVQDCSSFFYKFLQKHMYYSGDPKKQHTFMNNGFATHVLGRIWKLPQYRNDIGKHSVSDKNHAIDALMIGYLSPSYVQKISEAYKHDQHGLYIPYPYPNFKHDLNKISQRIYSRRFYKANNHVGIAKDTRYGATDMKNHVRMIRVPVTKLHLKKHNVIRSSKGIYDTKDQADKGFVKALIHYIKLPKERKSKNNKMKHKPDHFMYNGYPVYHVKVYSKFHENSMVLSKDHTSLFQNTKALKLRIYKSPDNKYCGTIEYAKNVELNQPSTLIADGLYKNHINKYYKRLFDLHPWTPVLCVLKPKNIKHGSKKTKSKEIDCGSNERLAVKIKITNKSKDKNKSKKSKKDKKKILVPLIKTIHGRTNKYIINGKTFGGVPYCQYVPSRILVKPKTLRNGKKKTSAWIGRRIMSNVFIGYVRKFAANGSIYLQPFDCTASADAVQQVKISRVKVLKKLKPESFIFNRFSCN